MTEAIIALVGALVGALITAAIGWLGIKRADQLARHRERQLDDRRHQRTLLLERLQAQLAAERTYMQLLEAIGSGYDIRERPYVEEEQPIFGTYDRVHAQIVASFGKPLADECLGSALLACEAIGVVPKERETKAPRGAVGVEESRILLATMRRINLRLAKELQLRPPEPWRPIRDALFKRRDVQLGGRLSKVAEQVDNDEASPE